jgi:hypothetical protein
MPDDILFNPLDKRNLGKSVVDALIERPVVELNAISPFPGAGVYAIYYKGGFAPYERLSSLNQGSETYPIYVGKAIPSGARKGSSINTTLSSTALSKRLFEHATTIALADSLNVSEFTCRYLVVDDIWIALGEALLIEKYQPLWNVVVEGFGNHDPGSGRYQGKRPVWDELHPGRPWADKCEPCKLSHAQILDNVSGYMDRLSSS